MAGPSYVREKLGLRPAAEPEPEPEPEPTEWPVHVGGGWYEIPDGSRHQGKEAAFEAMLASD